MEQPAPFPFIRVLLAEDHPLNQQVLRAMLVKLGCAVDVVSNGIDAVKAVASGPRYDLVLMDVHMPGLDGIEATRRIRALPGPAPRIVALTADATTEGRQICVDAGMTDFLGKPVAFDALRAVIGRERGGAGDSVAPQSAEGGEAPVLDRTLVERLYSLSGE
ncbi:MAG: response regulator, partial [Acidobacteria bacterium]|nr:response regulator [Acidobacteriota bacterium]